MKLIQNYLRILDDATYEKDIPSRRTMFPHEQILLQSCLDQLAFSREEYNNMISRCGPLSESTKQSLEINEEDHGKAIMVFTLVTIIFLPLSFVTSYLGMNTTDIRDMASNQSLFWIIAVPLTVVTMGLAMFIGYNGDDLRSFFASIYRTLTGKEDQITSLHGIRNAHRNRAGQPPTDINNSTNASPADEAEYCNPQQAYLADEYRRAEYLRRHQLLDIEPPYETAIASFQPYDTAIASSQRRTRVQTQAMPQTRISTAQHVQSRTSRPLARTTYAMNIDRRHSTTKPYDERDRDRDYYTSDRYPPLDAILDPERNAHRSRARTTRESVAGPGRYKYGSRVARAEARDEDEDEDVVGYTWHTRGRRGISRIVE